MASIAFSPMIGPVKLDVFVKATHRTEIGITSNPIETGAEVNDHAYVKPDQLTLDIGAQDAAGTYNALVAFQKSRVPFTIVTGLTMMTNMLIRSLEVEWSEDYSFVLKGFAELQEIIIVDTSYAAGTGDENSSTGGNPGGAKSSKSAKPSASRSGDANTADRASGTVTRGDSPTKAVPTTGGTPEATRNRSILSRLVS